MYWKYCVKRIINGAIIFVVIIFLFSFIFNKTMEETIRGQIEEEIHAELMSLTQPLKPEQLQKYMAERKTFKYHLYHLDESTSKRVIWRTINTITFNFGKSTIIKSSSGERDVWTIIAECIPCTILLFTVAILIDVILGLWLGLKKAQNAGKLLDKSTSIITMIVYGMPSWWLGMLMIMLFAYTIKIFPSGGLHSIPPPSGITYYLDILYHMALPVLTLIIIGFWGRAYLTRNIVLGVLQEDFIMSARARGIPERKVLYGHTLRTSAPPIVTMALLALLASAGGNIIFEGIFSWPGMGNLYWIALEQNDVPVLVANLAVTTILYIGGLVLLDLVYGWLDPRIKVGGRK
jgi:peptide/nickel transport system permease protein